MRKTMLGPGAIEVDSEELDHAVFSHGVVTDHGSHRRVVLSGGNETTGDFEAQARAVYSAAADRLHDLGGSMDDVVMNRVYVRGDVLSPATQATLHEVRAEFFEHPHYPASTVVGVERMIHSDAAVEIEIEAEIPGDGWETEVAE